MATLEVITQLNATVDEVLQDNDSGDISASDLKGLFRNFLSFSVDSAYAIWLEAGNAGNKADFLAYIKGKSTYELAVIAGYVGTQAEWITAQESSRVQAANSATTATEKASIAEAKALEASNSATVGSNSALSAIEIANNALSVANTATLQGVRLGGWNAYMNVPALTTDASSVVAGGYYDVIIAGVQLITSISENFGIGDRLIKVGAVWQRIPFAVSDNSVDFSKTTFLKDTENPEVLFALTDVLNRILLQITSDAKILGDFVINDSTISLAKLDILLNELLSPFKNTNEFESDSAYIITDNTGKKVLEITSGGMLKAFFDYSISKVSSVDITDELKSQLNQNFDYNADFSPYVYYITDLNNKVLFGIKTDGTADISPNIPNSSVGFAQLQTEVTNLLPTAQFLKQNSQNVNDFEVGDDDDLWRGTEVELPVRTNRTGYGFARFANLRTSGLRGINNTGVAVEFRVGEVIPIRGERYVSDFTPVAVGVLTTYKGIFRDDAVALPASPAIGDYYICQFFYINTKTRMLSGVTISEWDILYWNGSGWLVQASPAVSTTLKDGDFFNVLANGNFWNIAVKTGDRLIYLGTQTGGGWNLPVWIIQKLGEYFCMGECNPSSFSPATNRNGDLYVVSVDGTYAGIDLKKGDYLIRDSGVWGKSNGNLVTIANNTFFSIVCTNAKQISVRRTDKSVTQVDLKTKATYSNLRRKITNDVILYSDSMFGVNIGQAIIPLMTGKVTTIESYGGASTNDVLTMIRANIRKSDAYQGRIHVFWHGQNNNNDLTQIKAGALQMAELVGVQQSKFIMWSMIGSLSMNYNGTRLVDSNHEDAFNRVNNSRFGEIEDYYDIVFLGKHFSPRKAALVSALGRTRKNLQFPGMTEEEVATTYGITPFSYHFNFASVAWNPNDLIFKGYHSTAGLPTGGVDSDYKIRTANGSVGQIIVKFSGIWTEYAHDVTHITAEGGQAIAQQFFNFFSNLNY